ncbi:MAG: hypothetical protein H0X43_02780 [Nitrosospira sp.]|nr:hypothetical protein [Nitrosospira sp.]
MRCLPLTLFLASCTMLTPSSVEHFPNEQPASVPGAVISDSAEPDSGQPGSVQEASKPKPRRSPPPPPEILSCAQLDTGDLKETIKAKLDCITESAK